MNIAYLIAYLSFPRLVPLNIKQSRDILISWNSVRNDLTLRQSIKMYDVKDSVNLGSIGIVIENEVVAVALLEKMIGRVCVWNIESNDNSSGSLLVKALTKNKIIFMFTVHERWKIAKNFYSGT